MHKTPLHNIQLEAGGVSATFGDWERIAVIGDPEAEAEVAHKSAIIMDSSSFGKFSFTGPDAAKAIGRVIPKSVETLAPGRVTHFVLLDENGRGLDDGVVSRRSQDEFYMMTSTGRAASFGAWVTNQCEGLGLDYNLKDISHDYAAINLAGPRARDILTKLTKDDVSNEVFEFMRIRSIEIAGVPCSVLRIGFLGELGFELHMPSQKAETVWRALHEQGEQYGAQSTAIMGMSHLRLEKGHVIPGHDFDETTTFFEAGFGFAWDREHSGFVGEDALKRMVDERPERRLIRFKTEGRSSITPTSVLMAGDDEVGKMPSVHFSRVLGQTIGISLAENRDDLIKDGNVQIKTDDGLVEAQVLKGHSFFDPKGERMRA